jgi:hypothetical protein
VNNLYVQRLEKMFDAFIECWLNSFVADGIVPNQEDMAELHWKIEGIFAGSCMSPDLRPGQQLDGVEARAHSKLEAKALEMKLQANQWTETTPSYTTNIHTNLGAVQVGQHNTQNVTISQSVETLTNKLIEVVQTSSLGPLVKSEVIGHVYNIQHLETLDQSTTVIEQKREKLLTVDKLLSTTADVYTLAVPVIVLLKTAFGV